MSTLGFPDSLGGSGIPMEAKGFQRILNQNRIPKVLWVAIGFQIFLESCGPGGGIPRVLW